MCFFPIAFDKLQNKKTIAEKFKLKNKIRSIIYRKCEYFGNIIAILQKIKQITTYNTYKLLKLTNCVLFFTNGDGI